MFDSPLDLLALVIAIAALIFARKSAEVARQLRERVDRLEAARRSDAAASRVAPPPLPTDTPLVPEMMAPPLPALPVGCSWLPPQYAPHYGTHFTIRQRYLR